MFNLSCNEHRNRDGSVSDGEVKANNGLPTDEYQKDPGSNETKDKSYYGMFGLIAKKSDQLWYFFLPCAKIFAGTEVFPKLEHSSLVNRFLRINCPLNKQMLDQGLNIVDERIDLKRLESLISNRLAGVDYTFVGRNKCTSEKGW